MKSTAYPFPVMPPPVRVGRKPGQCSSAEALITATRTPPSISPRKLVVIFFCVALLHGLAFLLVKLASGGETSPGSGPDPQPKKEPTPVLTSLTELPAPEPLPAKPPEQSPKKEAPKSEVSAKMTALEFGAKVQPQTAPPPTQPTVETPAPPSEPVPTPDVVKPAPAPLKLPAKTEVDQRVARQWLSETNNRPGVLVTYDPTEITSLLHHRRGTLLASETKVASDQRRQEFCLAAPPQNGCAEFIDATGLASGLAGFGIVVHHDRGPLAGIAADLPAYFGFRPFTLQFIPDLALAQQIFAEVSRAFRAHGKQDGEAASELTVDGRLTVTGAEARFEVLKLRTPQGEVMIDAK